MSVQPGTILDCYQVLRQIAVGGTGEVWLASMRGPRGFARSVVVKTIVPRFASDERSIQRLVDQATISARLRHPNIVSTIDLGYVNHTYYLVREYVQGRTLSQILHRARKTLEGGVPTWFALQVVSACCDGLHYAHELCDENGHPLDLIHGALNPGTIMVAYTGHTAMLDVGVASLEGREPRRASLRSRLPYMAPERIRTQRADRQGDIFSLGVILHELVTGVRPFHAETDFELLRAILEDRREPARDHAPGLSPALEAVLVKALDSQPDRRHPSALALGRELRDLLETSGERRDCEDMARFVGSLFSDDPAPRHRVVALDDVG